MKVYRITVTTWPTEDGGPWPRFIAGPGTRITDPDDPVQFEDEFPWFEKLPDDVKAEFSAGDAEHTWDYGSVNEGVIGWVLPSRTRRHFLSASAAREWVRKARLLGATVTLETAEVGDWQEVR